MRNKNYGGFIQMPLLTAIIASVLIVSGAGYFGITQYQSYQAEKLQQEIVVENEQAINTTELSEIEKLRQEVEALKNKEPQTLTQTIIKEVPAPSAGSEISKNTGTQLTYVQNQTPNITEIVGNWRFFTAKVEHSDGLSWGSGFITKSSDGTFKILTNRHVIEGETIFIIRLPGNLIPFHSGVVSLGAGDFATISLGNSDEYLKNLIAGNAYSGICPDGQKPVLGDEIVVLGYPAVGSRNDVTVTRGIISGFDRNYFISDAKLNHGNSGGLAISVKNNCYFGIPTKTDDTDIEALGRILDIWKVMGQF